MGEVSSLDHEMLDDAVERAPFVTISFLSCKILNTNFKKIKRKGKGKGNWGKEIERVRRSWEGRPVHKERKFSAVLGTTSPNKQNTIRPTRSPRISTSKKHLVVTVACSSCCTSSLAIEAVGVQRQRRLSKGEGEERRRAEECGNVEAFARRYKHKEDTCTGTGTAFLCKIITQKQQKIIIFLPELSKANSIFILTFCIWFLR